MYRNHLTVWHCRVFLTFWLIDSHRFPTSICFSVVVSVRNIFLFKLNDLFWLNLHRAKQSSEFFHDHIDCWEMVANIRITLLSTNFIDKIHNLYKIFGFLHFEMQIYHWQAHAMVSYKRNCDLRSFILYKGDHFMFSAFIALSNRRIWKFDNNSCW